jgi:tetratricopeptide (TPR) repeat protein
MTVLKKHSQAIAVFSIIIAIVALDYIFRTSSNDAYLNGESSLSRNHTDEAISAFSQALRLNPADGRARLGLARAYHQKGWLDEAIKQYEQSIQAGTSMLHLAHYQLALALASKHEPEAALTHLKQSITIDPHDAAVYLEAAQIAERIGRKQDAKAYFATALQLDPKMALAVKKVF